jgi:hypothetical protein
MVIKTNFPVNYYVTIEQSIKAVSNADIKLRTTLITIHKMRNTIF